MLSEGNMNELRLEALTGLGGTSLLPATMLAEADDSLPRYSLVPTADEVSRITSFLVDHIKPGHHVLTTFVAAALESNRIFHEHDPYRIHSDEDEDGLLAQMRELIGALLLDMNQPWFLSSEDLVAFSSLLSSLIEAETTRTIDGVIHEKAAVKAQKDAVKQREAALHEKLLGAKRGRRFRTPVRSSSLSSSTSFSSRPIPPRQPRQPPPRQPPPRQRPPRPRRQRK